MNHQSLISQQFGTIYAQDGDNYKVICTFCGKKALWVHIDKRVYHCFACESSGLLGSLIPAYKIKLVGDINSLVDGIQKTIKTTTDLSVLPFGYHRVLDRSQFVDGWDYIASRDINPEKIEWGYFDPMHVCFPVRENHKVVYWQARAIYKRIKQKTVNPSKMRTGFGKENFVFRLDDLSTTTPAVIVEGIFDALTVNGVAMLGKVCSSVQAQKILSKKPPVIFVCYDADTWDKPQEWKEKERGTFIPYVLRTVALLRSMTKHTPVVPLHLQSQEDPADLGKLKMHSLILRTIRDIHVSTYLRSFGVSESKLVKLLRDW